MKDELRVTVVATGLGRTATKAAAPAVSAPQPGAAARRHADVKLVAARVRQAPPDYSHLDRPAVQRHQAQRAVGDGLRAPVSEDVLDIPAFLRRQAD
jgi:cell division protein FtsZ